MRTLRSRLLSLLVVASTAWPATAAVVQIDPTVTAVLDADFAPVDPSLLLANHRLAPRPEPYLLQVEVRVKVSELDEFAGLAYAAFDMRINGDGKSYFDANLGVQAWNPDNNPFDSNGPAPGGAVDKWLVNRDGGVDLNDLIKIELQSETINFGPPGIDIRRTLGQGPDGEVAGLVFVELPGTAGASTSVDILTPYESELFDANGEIFAGGMPIGGSSANWRVVPEPATWGLLSISAALTVLARRRVA